MGRLYEKLPAYPLLWDHFLIVPENCAYNQPERLGLVFIESRPRDIQNRCYGTFRKTEQPVSDRNTYALLFFLLHFTHSFGNCIFSELRRWIAASEEIHSCNCNRLVLSIRILFDSSCDGSRFRIPGALSYTADWSYAIVRCVFEIGKFIHQRIKRTEHIPEHALRNSIDDKLFCFQMEA
jgi:hypothetical protein